MKGYELHVTVKGDEGSETVEKFGPYMTQIEVRKEQRRRGGGTIWPVT